MSDFDQIVADIESCKAALAAKQAWNPAREGEIDIRIAADGRWYHEGRPFQRDALVKLFASVLRRERCLLSGYPDREIAHRSRRCSFCRHLGEKHGQ